MPELDEPEWLMEVVLAVDLCSEPALDDVAEAVVVGVTGEVGDDNSLCDLPGSLDKSSRAIWKQIKDFCVTNFLSTIPLQFLSKYLKLNIEYVQWYSSAISSEKGIYM